MAGKTAPQKKNNFIEAYKASLFNISKACAAAEITRRTYYNWIQKDEKFKDKLEEAKQERKDFAEGQLFILARGVPKLSKENKLVGWIEKPSPAAVIFLNKTLNKDRGYVEKVEHEVSVPEETVDLSSLSLKEQKDYLKLLRKASKKENDPSNKP